MAVNPSRGRVFDAIADTYARVRPGYPTQLFDAMIAGARVAPGALVLEIGCGPGTATAALLARGLRVIAVEPGQAMADAARTRHPGGDFEVEVCSFEEWPLIEHGFDLVVAATSIHWVNPDARWRKTAQALRPGGSLALLTNVTVSGSTFSDLYRETADLHARFVGTDDTESPTASELLASIDAHRDDIGMLWGAIETYGGSVPAKGFYGPSDVHIVEWEREFSADDAIALLSTFSTYLVLDPSSRAELFARMRQIIEAKFGGRVTRRYVAVLAVAPVMGSTP